MKFNSKNVLLDINVANQEAALELISNKVQELGFTNDATSLKEDFLKREQEFSTGFGNGVAIPHAKTNDVKDASVFFARLTDGVEWNSMDGNPVKLILAIIVPADASKEHLDTLAKLSRKIIHKDFIQILNDGTQEEITEAITSALS